MKIASKIIEELQKLTDSAIKAAFEQRLEDFEFENITIDDVDHETSGDTVITFGDDEDEMVEVLFSYDEEDGALAIILDPEKDLTDDEDDELDIIELDPVEPKLLEWPNGDKSIDLVNLEWLTENTLQAILTVGDLIDDQEDAEGELDERSIVVVRGGKKVRLPVVRRKRRKRLSSKQKRAIRKGVRTRKRKASQIARKRKRSLKVRKRSSLKRNTNKRLKVKGTSRFL